MPRMTRGNAVMYVQEHEVQYYLSKGYNLTSDGGGKILKESVPTDMQQLQRHFVDSNKRIAELEAEVARLTRQLTEASKPKKK